MTVNRILVYLQDTETKLRKRAEAIAKELGSIDDQLLHCHVGKEDGRPVLRFSLCVCFTDITEEYIEDARLLIADELKAVAPMLQGLIEELEGGAI